ncbi:MAG: glutamate 5-kinase [Edaphocola sp.]
MRKPFKRITVKIGSNVIARADGTLDVARISALVAQVAGLHKQGTEILLVSSGAVASGRSALKPAKKMDVVDERQLFSAIGQAKLMNHYWQLFEEHGITVGQLLTTKENFADRRGYLNQRNCLWVMLANGVVPVINENDAVSVTELMFTDNDELSGLVASMMNADALFILSNVDGIYTGMPGRQGVELIPTIETGTDVSSYVQATKSSFGRGGMLTKTKIAQKISEEGIDVFIANGRRDQILPQLMANWQETPCTHFPAAKEGVSSVKKWIAHSDGFAKGSVFIDENAMQALHGTKAVSLLPVGVVRIEGDFEKDDIIRIFTDKGKYIGVGKAAYSSEKVQEVLGTKNQKPLVHYNYLHLE